MITFFIKNFNPLQTSSPILPSKNIISELRNDGNWIINRGEGYYRARSQKDREYVIKEYTSRIAKMSIIVRNLNTKSEGQITM